MAIIYQSEQPKSISLNSTDLDSATYNNVQVFLKDTSKLITSFATAHTDESRVPPPYDSNGYNFGGSAPEKTATLTISLGDTTGFDAVKFNWNNDGSINTYGDISGKITWNEETITLFDDIGQSGEQILEFYTGMPESLVFDLKAKSSSSYNLYISEAHLNLINVMLIKL